MTVLTGSSILYYTSKIYEGQGHIWKALEALDRCLSIRDAIMPHHHYTGLALGRMGGLLDKTYGPEMAM